MSLIFMLYTSDVLKY